MPQWYTVEQETGNTIHLLYHRAKGPTFFLVLLIILHQRLRKRELFVNVQRSIDGEKRKRGSIPLQLICRYFIVCLLRYCEHTMPWMKGAMLYVLRLSHIWACLIYCIMRHRRGDSTLQIIMLVKYKMLKPTSAWIVTKPLLSVNKANFIRGWHIKGICIQKCINIHPHASTQNNGVNKLPGYWKPSINKAVCKNQPMGHRVLEKGSQSELNWKHPSLSASPFSTQTHTLNCQYWCWAVCSSP